MAVVACHQVLMDFSEQGQLMVLALLRGRVLGRDKALITLLAGFNAASIASAGIAFDSHDLHLSGAAILACFQKLLLAGITGAARHRSDINAAQLALLDNVCTSSTRSIDDSVDAIGLALTAFLGGDVFHLSTGIVTSAHHHVGLAGLAATKLRAASGWLG